ncbi:hypothetical protein [Bernardetia sp.]|uniref:hypothetical protein n=1 Tax=Bernardetia sp. TaxID=1937974 RepID=UPI0025C100B5|nr:hypothetical protein [Bernardetia sp.]
MKYLILLLSIIFLSSCTKEEQKNPLYEQLVGNYYASTIFVEEDIDINGDGIFSQNVLGEFGEQLNSSNNRLEIKPNELSGKEVLIINFPSLDPQSFILDTFITNAISLGGEYTIKDSLLISEDKDITSIKLMDNNILEVKGTMDYLTYNGTKQITYTALYERE